MAVIVLATMTANNLIDEPTAQAIQTTLDLPTAVTLVVFSMLSVKLELDKPKYRQIKRTTNIDMLLILGGGLIILALVYLKYFV